MKSIAIILFSCYSLVAWCQDIGIGEIEAAGLPVLYIETVDEEVPTYDVIWNKPEEYLGNTIKNATKVPGRISISNGGQIVYDSGPYEDNESGMTIRVRGNTSALLGDKKPYKIKLQKKADLLCRGNDSIYKDKNWLLIKDHNFRNMIAFKVNELIGLQWTPAFQYVNVILNGQYEGLYMLVENVKRNTRCRLNVSDTGYVAEFDPYFWNEKVYVESSLERSKTLPMHYTFKYPDPEDISREEIEYFRAQVHKAEDSLSDGTYADHIDLNSFARWMLAHEILGNNDGAGSNIFLTKYDNTADSKFMMGCLWDMEGSFRAKDQWDGVHGSGVFFYYDLFEDIDCVDFRNTFAAIWRDEQDTIFDGITAFLDELELSEGAEAIRQSVVLDNSRWGADNDPLDECIAYAREWFAARRPWLNGAMKEIHTGIRDVQSTASETDAPIYYDLRGLRVENPSKGVFIRKSRSRTDRVVFR